MKAICHLWPISVISVNTYDTKHLRLLDIIEGGQWEAISENHLDELKVLVVCKYVSLGNGKNEKPIRLNPEGRHYHRHLSRLATRFGQTPDEGYRAQLPG
jgi:hypothetical protein